MSVVDTESPEFKVIIDKIIDDKINKKHMEEVIPLMIKTINDRVDAKSHDTETRFDKRLVMIKKNMGEKFHRISKILQEG